VIKIWNLNDLQKRIPCSIFTKFCRVCAQFQGALALEIWLDLLKGLWSYGGFKLTGSGYPQTFSASSGETIRQTLKVLEEQERA